MKKENRVYLAAIRRRMQRRYGYINRNEAFAAFWYGWTHQCLRRKTGTPRTFLNWWKKGYIHVDRALDFWAYITA